jgi:hypothetical protein
MRRICTFGLPFLLLIVPVASADVLQNGSGNPISADEAPLPLDGTWTVLDEFMSVGDFFSGPWSYTSPLPIMFTITDLFVVSDQFEVYLDAALVATTPAVADWPAYAAGPFDPPWTTDPDAALGSGVFSGGVYMLPAGTHDVTIRDIHIPPTAVGGPPFSDGTVAFKATRVPEPATLSLLSIAALALLRRRS